MKPSSFKALMMKEREEQEAGVERKGESDEGEEEEQEL